MTPKPRRADAADLGAVLACAATRRRVRVHAAAKSRRCLVVGQHGRGRTAALATDVAPHWVGGLVDWGDRARRPGGGRRVHRGRQLVRPVLPQSAGVDGDGLETEWGTVPNFGSTSMLKGTSHAPRQCHHRSKRRADQRDQRQPLRHHPGLPGAEGRSVAMLGMRFGIEGFMKGDVIDLGREEPGDDRGPAHDAQLGPGKLPPQAQGRRLPADPRDAPASTTSATSSSSAATTRWTRSIASRTTAASRATS